MKVGWFSSDDIETGNSGRNIVFPVHDWLLKEGIESTVLFAPIGGLPGIPKAKNLTQAILSKRFTHLVFQKLCLGYTPTYLKLAKMNGIITVYTIDDYLVGNPDHEMIAEADILIANSKFMREYIQTKYHKKVSQIPCAYNIDRNFCKTDYHTDKFTAFWHGSVGNIQQGLEFKQMMQIFSYNFELIAPQSTMGDLATIPWRRDYHKDLLNADVIVLPCLHPMRMVERAKGEGRPLQSMILGIPTVVSPFPDYTKLITNGVDGIICYTSTPYEFLVCLEYLQDEKVREAIGKAGRKRVIDEYHIDSIGKRWLEALEQ